MNSSLYIFAGGLSFSSWSETAVSLSLIVFVLFSFLYIFCKFLCLIQSLILCWKVVAYMNSVKNMQHVAIHGICDSTSKTDEAQELNPYAPPPEYALSPWPIIPPPRYKATELWAQKHNLLFLGCVADPMENARLARWFDPNTRTVLTYMYHRDGGEMLGIETEFVNQDSLVTSDAPTMVAMPYPPKYWKQVFPDPKSAKQVFGTRESDLRRFKNRYPIADGNSDRQLTSRAEGNAENPELNESEDVRNALERIESLWALHEQGVRCLVDNDLEVLGSYGIGSFEKYWKRNDISFIEAAKSKELSPIQEVLCRMNEDAFREEIEYIRSFPFWRIRIGGWIIRRSQKLINLSIEEQVSQLKRKSQWIRR